MDVGREGAKNGIIQSPQQKMTRRPPRPSEAALLKFLALQLRILCRKKSVGEKGALVRVRVRQLRFPCRLRPPDEKLAAPISVAVVGRTRSLHFYLRRRGRGLRLEYF